MRVGVLVIGGIDKVPAVIIIRVQKLETGGLVHRSHSSVCPLVTDAHGTELEGRNMDTRVGREATETSELGGRLWGGRKERHFGCCSLVLKGGKKERNDENFVVTMVL